MDAIYQMPDGRRLLIYAEQERIMAYIFPYMRGRMPAVLKTDYLDGLHSVLWGNAVWMLYRNLEGQVVLEPVDHGERKILLTPKEGCQYYDWKLCICREELFVLYTVYLAETHKYEFHVKMVSREMDDDLCVFDTAIRPAVQMMDIGTEKFIVGENAEGKWQTYKWERELFIVPDSKSTVADQRALERKYAQQADKKIQAAELSCEDRIREMEVECTKRIQIMEHTYREQKEAAEIACQKGIEAAEIRFKHQIEEQCVEKLGKKEQEYQGFLHRKEKNFQIELAKAAKEQEELREQLRQTKQQYDELAAVAKELQKAGRQWRERYQKAAGEKLQ